MKNIIFKNRNYYLSIENIIFKIVIRHDDVEVLQDQKEQARSWARAF